MSNILLLSGSHLPKIGLGSDISKYMNTNKRRYAYNARIHIISNQSNSESLRHLILLQYSDQKIFYYLFRVLRNTFICST